MLVKNENLRKFYEISCNNLKLIYFISMLTKKNSKFISALLI